MEGKRKEGQEKGGNEEGREGRSQQEGMGRKERKRVYDNGKVALTVAYLHDNLTGVQTHLCSQHFSGCNDYNNISPLQNAS